MSRIKIIQILLLAAFASSCSKDDPTMEYGGDEASNTISFGTTAQWTKGYEVTALTDISTLTLYNYLIEGGWESDGEIEPYFTDDVATPITLTPANDDATSWYYDGGWRYWPTDENRMLSFLAYYPASELTATVVNEGEKPTFSYTMSTLANENDDLVFNAQIDKTSQDGTVNFDLEHLLTKLSLEVKLDGDNPDDGISYDHTKDVYTVNGISFAGLYPGATLHIDADGTTSWTIDEAQSTIELTAAQNNTLVPIYTYDDAGNQTGINSEAKLTNTGYTSVMASGKGIFVLPQDLSVYRKTAPTTTIRIRRLYYSADDLATGASYPSGELIYSSGAITIPVPSNDGETTGWEQGMHNALQYTFYLESLSEYDTPLTLTSTIYPWTTVDVDVTVNPNIYIYASDTDFELKSDESTADMYLYTNYSSDLRISKTKQELDASLTTANGFTFYRSGSSTSYIPQLVSPLSTDGNEILLSCEYNVESSKYVVGGTELSTYDGADGFPDMSAYVCKDGDVPGDPIYCYPYGSYTGTMSDNAQWLKFKVTISDTYSFYYYAALLVRGQLGLYTNPTIEDSKDNSEDYNAYGVNKSENDAVYILRLDVEDSHLISEDGTDYATATGDAYGYFYGSIGTELLSDGGGKITYKFGVSLKKAL